MASPTPFVDRLLAHDRWIRRLAAAVARGEGLEASDVAQETWLRVLQAGAARPARVLRGWLGVVVGNTARNLRRGSSRRRQRERLAGRPAADGGPGPFDFAVHEERRRLLVQAVERLPAPQRRVVIERFWEGLEPAAIARRNGESAEAVRQRLHRALHALRADLDIEARETGSRAAWLAPLLLRPRMRAEGASTLAVTGALLMKKTIAVAAVLAVAFLGIVVWAPWQAPARPVPAPALPAEVHAARASHDPAPGAPAQRAPLARAAGAAAAALATLADAHGTPLGGVAFWADEHPYRMHPGRAPQGAPRTSAAGRFDPGEAAGAGAWLWFEVDDGLSVAVERAALTAQPLVCVPARRDVEVEIRGLPVGAAWRMATYPAWLDAKGASMTHGSQHAQPFGAGGGAPVWVARRFVQRAGASGPARTCFRLVAGLPAAFLCSSPAVDVEPEIQELVDPRAVVAQAGAAKVVLAFEVVAPGGAGPEPIGGRVLLARAGEDALFAVPFADGTGSIARSRGEANEQLRAVVLLEDGEVFETAWRDHALGAERPLRLVRGTGRPPAATLPLEAGVASWPEPTVHLEAGGRWRRAQPYGWFAPLVHGGEVGAWVHARHLVVQTGDPAVRTGRVLFVAADGRVARSDDGALAALPSRPMQPIAPRALVERFAPAGTRMLLVQHQLALPGSEGGEEWLTASSHRLHRPSPELGWRLSRTASIDVHESLPEALATFAPLAARSRILVRRSRSEDVVLPHEPLR